MSDKIILEGEFVTFPSKSYPGRIYGMYSWDEKNNNWVLSEEWKRRKLVEEREKKLGKICQRLS